MPFQRLDEEEPEAGAILQNRSRFQLPFAKQVCLKLPNVIRTESVGRLMEMLSKFAYHTYVSPCGILRVVAALEFLQHHVS